MPADPGTLDDKLEAAGAARAAGDAQSARALALAAAGAAPEDVNLLHNAGVVLREVGATADALEVFARVLRLLPNFHFTEIEVGYAHTDCGDDAEALRWFLKACQSAPHYPLGYLRAAQAQQRLGRADAALVTLQAGRVAAPADRELAAELARTLACLGQHEDALAAFAELQTLRAMLDEDWATFFGLLTELGRLDDVLAQAADLKIPATSSAGYAVAVIVGQARLATGLNRPALIAMATEREKTVRFRSAPLLALDLRAAIAARRPFSLIRLGDGEGRFLAYCDPVVRGSLSGSEARLVGDVAWRNWFGQPIESVAPQELALLYAHTMTAILRADILGVASADRLARDHKHFGFLGYAEQLLVPLAQYAPKQHFCDATAHIALHRFSPFYAALLGDLEFLALISPHPGLAARLQAVLRVADVVEYIIPGESRLPEAARQANAPPHFPDVYQRLMESLVVPYEGAVFLVAGGLLGKIYCNHIKNLGGIAVDIGSIVDAWMGYNTRQGHYEPQSDWLLPTAILAAG